MSDVAEEQAEGNLRVAPDVAVGVADGEGAAVQDAVEALLPVCCDPAGAVTSREAVASRPLSHRKGVVDVRYSSRQVSWLNIVLGVWLFISPWVLDFVSAGDASRNAWIVGAAIAVIAVIVAAMGVPYVAWANVVLGAWLFISPWALTYTNLDGASWNAWIVGVLVVMVALISASAAGGVRQPPSRLDTR